MQHAVIKPPRKTKTEPSEWQVDEQGRRFRMIGNVKEYEPTIRIDGIEIPQSDLAAYHERKKAAEAARKEAEKKAQAVRPAPQFCPFNSGLRTECNGEKCALYLDGCTLARLTDRPAAKATEGLQCPICRYNYNCRTDCTLYENGCKLTAII